MQLEIGKKYTLTLTAEEIGLIQSGLVELPYKYSAQLINDLPNKISEVKDLEQSEYAPPIITE